METLITLIPLLLLTIIPSIIIFIVLWQTALRTGNTVKELRKLNSEFNKYFRWYLIYNKGNEKEKEGGEETIMKEGR